TVAFSMAEASHVVGIDRSEILRTGHRGELRIYKKPGTETQSNSLWFVQPADLFKIWPAKNEPLERPRISVAAYCLQFICLMAARPEQVLFMRWEQLKMPGLLVIPWHQHKVGRKTKKPLHLPLSGAAKAIIHEMEVFQNSDVGVPSEFVFAHGRALVKNTPGSHNGKPLAPPSIQNVFDKTIDRPGMTVYGVARHTFSTWAYAQARYYPYVI